MKSIFIVIASFISVLLVCAADAAEYRLDIDRLTVNITGHPIQKIAVNGTIPGPTLVWAEGEEVVIHVTNHLDEETSIHWHGILVPGNMDGVKDFNNYPAIKPGKTFTYHFTVRQNGTYWYHAHTDGQEQDGLYGALIIKPKDKDPVAYDREHVLMFADFSDEAASNILANLKMTSDYYSKVRRTVGDFFSDVKAKGFSSAWKDARMWGEMRMSKTDLSDVSGYTFLVNGKTPQQNTTFLFKPGERVRLHLINASAMTFFDVRILDTENKRLKMTVVQADGRNVEPVPVDEFRFGIAETYDVIVTPTEDKAYTIVAEPIDRSGFALATLAPREELRGLQPQQRLRAQLTMADMGMDISSMGHDSMTPGEMEDMMNSGWANASIPVGDVALSYSDLRSLNKQSDTREPDREINVRLGGNMERYIWTINDKKMEEATPIKLKLGERVRLTFKNESMMAHPMHLHGMFVQLDNGQPTEKLPDKTVVIVPPGQSYSVLLSANEPGEWAFHCHLLYHMASGMMTKVVVATLDTGTEEPHAH